RPVTAHTFFFQLCRTVEDETLWACLAVLAWQHNQLAVAEEAFALIHQYYQVCYIQHLRSTIPEKLPVN
ncbi:jg7864, partial [Pararge aegeria aegeria]